MIATFARHRRGVPGATRIRNYVFQPPYADGQGFAYGRGNPADVQVMDGVSPTRYSNVVRQGVEIARRMGPLEPCRSPETDQ